MRKIIKLDEKQSRDQNLKLYVENVLLYVLFPQAIQKNKSFSN